MKTLITMITAAAILAVPTFVNAAPRHSSDLVVVNGKLVGQDPDVNIRGALMKDPYPVGD